jgi:hypothetical protein
MVMMEMVAGAERHWREEASHTLVWSQLAFSTDNNN